jgi:hypothetical protein
MLSKAGFSTNILKVLKCVQTLLYDPDFIPECWAIMETS